MGILIPEMTLSFDTRKNKKGLQSMKPFVVAAPLIEESCSYNSLIEYVTIRKLGVELPINLQ